MPHVGAEGFCFRLFNRVRSTYKFFRWLDSNSRSLVLEATALPTAPHRCPTILHLKNGPTPASFPFIFSLFKQTLQIYATNICEKCPSSIRCRDSNPQPSEHKSPPITTRPGLPHWRMLQQQKFIVHTYVHIFSLTDTHRGLKCLKRSDSGSSRSWQI